MCLPSKKKGEEKPVDDQGEKGIEPNLEDDGLLKDKKGKYLAKRGGVNLVTQERKSRYVFPSEES